MRSGTVLLCVLLALACSHRADQGVFLVQAEEGGAFGTWSIDCTRSARDCVMPLDAGAPLLPELSWWDPLRGQEPIRCSAGKVCGGDWSDGGVIGGYSPAEREPGPVPQPR